MNDLRDQINELMLSLRTKLEDNIKNVASEFLHNHVHKDVFVPVKQAILQIDQLTAGDPRNEFERQLVVLRLTLDTNPKERKVQDMLLDLEKTGKVRIASLSEVSVEMPTGRKGRIDILARSLESSEPGRIIELKRPSVKLVAYASTDSQRPSRSLKNVLKQIGQYQESKLTNRGVDCLAGLRKTVVAGRSFTSLEPYLTLASEEQVESVDIYSWDAWIDRIERIHT